MTFKERVMSESKIGELAWMDLTVLDAAEVKDC
jgi:hypothetical protein